MGKSSPIPFSRDPFLTELHRRVLECIRDASFSFALPTLNADAWKIICTDPGARERLEFLGDSLVGNAVSEELMKLWPSETPGFYTKCRTVLVTNVTFAHLMWKAGICRMDKNMKPAGDAFEAIMALYHDKHGDENFKRYIHEAFGPLFTVVGESYHQNMAKPSKAKQRDKYKAQIHDRILNQAAKSAKERSSSVFRRHDTSKSMKLTRVAQKQRIYENQSPRKTPKKPASTLAEPMATAQPSMPIPIPIPIPTVTTASVAVAAPAPAQAPAPVPAQAMVAPTAPLDADTTRNLLDLLQRKLNPADLAAGSSGSTPPTPPANPFNNQAASASQSTVAGAAAGPSSVHGHAHDQQHQQQQLRPAAGLPHSVFLPGPTAMPQGFGKWVPVGNIPPTPLKGLVFNNTPGSNVPPPPFLKGLNANVLQTPVSPAPPPAEPSKPPAPPTPSPWPKDALQHRQQQWQQWQQQQQGQHRQQYQPQQQQFGQFKLPLPTPVFGFGNHAPVPHTPLKGLVFNAPTIPQQQHLHPPLQPQPQPLQPQPQPLQPQQQLQYNPNYPLFAPRITVSTQEILLSAAASQDSQQGRMRQASRSPNPDSRSPRPPVSPLPPAHAQQAIGHPSPHQLPPKPMPLQPLAPNTLNVQPIQPTNRSPAHALPAKPFAAKELPTKSPVPQYQILKRPPNANANPLPPKQSGQSNSNNGRPTPHRRVSSKTADELADMLASRATLAHGHGKDQTAGASAAPHQVIDLTQTSGTKENPITIDDD